MGGFTLIELLVVIGVLGILAAGLLAAIDPLEQLRKGRDTTNRNIAVELNSALIRYNAINADYPWGTGVQAPTVIGAVTGTIIQTLIDVGELKPTFINALPGGSASSLTLIGAVTGEIFVCFNPESKSISADPTTIFANTSNPPTQTTGCTATGTCYWCAR